MKKIVFESLEDILRPRGVKDVLNAIENLSVSNKIKKIKEMHSKWGGMYKDLLRENEIIQNIRDEVKNELSKLDVLDKVNYIENIEKDLPDIFSGMKDQNLLNELKEYIIDQDFENKARLVWKFFKSWPDLFKDVEDDERIDPETNQIMLLFKIKGAIDSNEIDKVQELIQEMGEKYGREEILDKAQDIKIPGGRYEENNLFNKKDIQQLKLSLYKETRSEEEKERDEIFDVYAFIGYFEFIEKEVNRETLHKKVLGIENLVKIDKYDSSSLSQVSMMKLRARAQGGDHTVFGVYIPKYMWNRDYAYNNDIPDDIREFIDENKFKI